MRATRNRSLKSQKYQNWDDKLDEPAKLIKENVRFIHVHVSCSFLVLEKIHDLLFRIININWLSDQKREVKTFKIISLK